MDDATTPAPRPPTPALHILGLILAVPCWALTGLFLLIFERSGREQATDLVAIFLNAGGRWRRLGVGEQGFDAEGIAGDIRLQLVEVLMPDVVGSEAKREAFRAVQTRSGESQELGQATE